MLARWNADGGDERFRFDYELNPDSVVLDIGGYEGQWASDLYTRQRCQIHVFEPVRSFASTISERFAGNSDVQVHAYALGAENRIEMLNVAGASSSAHKRKKLQEEVEFRDIQEWYSNGNIGDIALMKINIEGGEYELLERMLETDLVRHVHSLQIQFHYFVEDATSRMAAIQHRLAVTHSPTWQYQFIWENWKRKH